MQPPHGTPSSRARDALELCRVAIAFGPDLLAHGYNGATHEVIHGSGWAALKAPSAMVAAGPCPGHPGLST